MKISVTCNNENPLDLIYKSLRVNENVNTKEKINFILNELENNDGDIFQHIYFTFKLEDISNLSVWRFFHSHRFYESSQVNYKKLKPESFYEIENSSLFNKKICILHEELVDIFTDIFLNSKNPIEVKNAKNNAIINANYILPQSLLTTIYHTISLSTLIKYLLSKNNIKDSKIEISNIINKMKNILILKYPELKIIFNKCEDLNTIELESIYTNNIIDFYNDHKDCKIIDYSIFSDNIEYFFKNDKFGLSSLHNTELGSTFIKLKLFISLMSDKENQKHKTTYSLRPELNKIIHEKIYKNRLNYFMPSIFIENDRAIKIFNEAISQSISQIKENNEYASYFLLNAFQIPVMEFNTGLDLISKVEKRLCLNSLEEITKTTWCLVNEIKKIDILENFSTLLAPPCVHRYNMGVESPCPKGSQYCGIKEWKGNKYK